MRQSNFELLRIICIILIILMHITACAFTTSNNLNKLLILGINTIGNTGVTIFILISGYFSIQFNIRKLIITLCTIWFYSITSYIFLLCTKQSTIQLSDTITTFFPVLRDKYWFITCYIILYCLSPYLNRIVYSLSKKEFELLLAILSFFFVISPTFLYNEILNDGGKGIINLTLIYLIGQYIRTYGVPLIIKKYSLAILLISLFCIFCLNTTFTFSKEKIILKFAHDNSLFILISSITFFLQISKWNYSSQFINKMAQYVFPLYLIQALLTTLFAESLTTYINHSTFIIYVLSVCIFICLITLIVEKIRKTLFQKVNEKIAIHIENILLSLKNFK